MAGDNGLRILVFGTTPPCARCLQAEKEAVRAAQRFPAGRVTLEKHDAQSETARKYGVAITPTVIIEDKKFAVGKILTEEELVGIIRNLLEA